MRKPYLFLTTVIAAAALWLAASNPTLTQGFAGNFDTLGNFRVKIDAIASSTVSTAANQTTGNSSLSSIDGKTPALGQALAAASVPVILPSATITTLTPPAAITGFATAANQATANSSLSSIDGKFTSTAAMADGESNPTLSRIAAYMKCWNGSTWDRCQANAPSSTKHYISVGTSEDKFQVKGSAGVLTGATITNSAATVAYFRCSDQVTGSTTPGTTTVFWGYAVPGATTGAGIAPPLPADGLTFTTGLTCWIVGGKAETDVAEVGANDVQVNVYYK
jgi:hypothetical protein